MKRQQLKTTHSDSVHTARTQCNKFQLQLLYYNYCAQMFADLNSQSATFLIVDKFPTNMLTQLANTFYLMSHARH